MRGLLLAEGTDPDTANGSTEPMQASDGEDTASRPVSEPESTPLEDQQQPSPSDGRRSAQKSRLKRVLQSDSDSDR